MPPEVEAAIYETALSLEDPALQHQFLELTLRDHPAARARMHRLLASAGDAATFFLEARDARADLATHLVEEIDPTPPPAPPAPAQPGTTIGHYRLLHSLGQGGSGIVYEAEQTHPVQRRVALKLFWIDTASPMTRARFDIERQALAIMDHPHIAKVLDVGGEHHGSPYFVLELVQGLPITTYCDRERLDLPRRLRLFLDVCDAIQHAHSKRIIHRDIKPSNILVSGPPSHPVAKVIDFGIAKAVHPHPRLHPLRTSHDQFLGTPAYMSPEQVEMIGMDVDTRSDVYSLGVLLYELLTSQTPFDRKMLMSAGVAAMRKLILDNRHHKPSARLQGTSTTEIHAVAAARHVEPTRLLTQVQGDLDLIVMKALEKDRNLRYETANALAQDLKRYLENKPVAARRPNKLYSFHKFVHRHRVPFFSGVAVALSILLGFGVSTVLYFREREALTQQERLSREARQSRDQELALRHQAQARANVSRAAFLLAEGRLSEAEELLQQTPLVSIEPSREASTVFKTLGNWYATYGRWAEAVQCFRLMEQAMEMARPEDVLRGTDLLIMGPALLELGDKKAYQSFRQAALARYLPATDSLQAEHILKACLIIEPTPEILRQLEEAAAFCRENVHHHDPQAFPAWEAFSLALYHHRRGEPETVLEVARLAQAAPNIREICAAGLRVMAAMAHHRLHQPAAARTALQQAQAVILRPRSDDGSEEKAIFHKWYDWSVATMLLREAERVMGNSPAPPSPSAS